MRVPYFVFVFSMFIYETTGVSKSGEEVKDFGTKYQISVRKAQLDGCWHSQRRIQDFPKVGALAGEGGNIPNFPQNCMKLKEFGRPSCPPLRSATDILFLPLLEKVGEK